MQSLLRHVYESLSTIPEAEVSGRRNPAPTPTCLPLPLHAPTLPTCPYPASYPHPVYPCPSLPLPCLVPPPAYPCPYSTPALPLTLPDPDPWPLTLNPTL